MATVSDLVWSAQDTTPGRIEGALRDLLNQFHQQHPGYVPARALNLVCIVDKAFSGEIANRLRGVGRYHASRTVVCSVEPGRDRLDAVATVASNTTPRAGGFALLRETVVVSLGERHLDDLDRIVDPLVVTDLATVVWSPHRHHQAVDALTIPAAGHLPLAQVVLLDSVMEEDPDEALDRVGGLAERAYVVDLAWLRSTPWRERVAAAFDPPARRPQLGRLAKVSVRHHPASSVAGLLFLGWLCSRLGWRPEALHRRESVHRGRARSRRGEVELRLETVEDMSVPGLAGVLVETADGEGLALERGRGGLTARRRDRKGAEVTYTVLGASRGEPGILGEGIRQALLRDRTYADALAAARSLV